MITTKDLQRMIQYSCTTCHYDWNAPTAQRCPKCHSDTLVKGDTRINVLPRV